MKTCFKCEETKPLDDFYAHPMMADGHLNKCKPCARRDAREHRESNYNDVLLRERSYGRTEKKMVSVRRYRDRMKSEDPARWKKMRRASLAASHARYPEKNKARQILSNAVRDGKLARPDCCEKCGKACTPHGHHHDYSKPLDVMWLCTRCHGLEHRK